MPGSDVKETKQTSEPGEGLRRDVAHDGGRPRRPLRGEPARRGRATRPHEVDGDDSCREHYKLINECGT